MQPPCGALSHALAACCADDLHETLSAAVPQQAAGAPCCTCALQAGHVPADEAPAPDLVQGLGYPKPLNLAPASGPLRAQVNLEFPVQLPSRLHEKFPRASGLLGPDVPGSLSDQGLDLLKGLLRLDPAKRLTAAQALDHPW